MEQFTRANFINELQKLVDKSFDHIQTSNAMAYALLHEYTKTKIIPIIQRWDLTIATVELTTCGLISDLITGSSGASHFFIMGMIPYSNEMKIKLGIQPEDLSFRGYGVVSSEVAKNLAQRIKDYSGAKIGIAETGLLSSKELKLRKTKKKAGEVYSAIAIYKKVFSKKLSIQRDLTRTVMRQEIAFRVLEFLETFLNSSNYR